MDMVEVLTHPFQQMAFLVQRIVRRRGRLIHIIALVGTP